MPLLPCVPLLLLTNAAVALATTTPAADSTSAPATSEDECTSAVENMETRMDRWKLESSKGLHGDIRGTRKNMDNTMVENQMDKCTGE